MRSYIKSSVAILIVLMTIAGCGGSTQSNSDSNETQSSNSTASEDTSSTSDTSPTEEDTSEDSSEVSDEVIAKIGYGHFADDIYLKQVTKNMNGSQEDKYSEAQLFNYARNTCTDLKAGNYQKIINMLKDLKGSSDSSFVISMTQATVFMYCQAYEEPFFAKATAAGL